MKALKTIFSFFLIVSAINLSAQEYIPMLQEGKIWNFTTENYPQPPDYPGDTTTISYILSGDTVINSITYKTLYQTSCTESGDAQVSGNPVAFLRENTSSKQVFVHSGGEEFLLYDFSVQTGDTLYAENYIWSDINYLVVTDTDTSVIDGTARKTIHFSLYPDLGWTGAWTAGIGSSTTLINYIQGDGAYTKSLNCLFENGTLVYHNTYETCCPGELTSVRDAKSLNNQITLFPNPAVNILNIEFSGTESSRIRIFDVSASLIYQEKLHPGKSKINISQLPAGIYIAKITGKNESICRRFSVR
ncbi:MAG: T9SS type A sorting domain-containing protein [Bacteroidales bacterium]